MRTLFFILITIFFGYNNSPQLHPVSVSDFSKFIEETGYVTDAEKFGWSIIQENVYHFRIDNLFWINQFGLSVYYK